MKFPKYTYLEPNGEGTGGSSGTPSKPTFDPNSDEVKDFVRSQIESAVSGLRAKNEELLNEKKNLTEKFSIFDELDPNVLRTYVERLKTDEEAKLIAEGKIDDVIERRTERMRKALTDRIDDITKNSKDWEEKYSQIAKEFDNTRIDFAIRDAALEAKVAPTAISDVLVRARNEFYVDEKGNILSRDPLTGEVRIGPDGKTPYSPADFISELEKKAPHFWPSSASGNLSGAFGTPTDVEHAMRAAIASGDMRRYRKIREELRANANK